MDRSKADILATLSWLVEAGADETLSESPTDRFAEGPQAARARSQASAQGSEPVRPSDTRPRPAAPRPSAAASGSAPPATRPASTDAIGQAMELSTACTSLEQLRAALEGFEGCSLKKSAKKTVFADGISAAGIMLIGEAPGREEDAAGLPFVGRAGKLLDRMLASIGLDRRKNAYITNVLNWRPPDNRDPSPEEAGACLPFLRRHIELVSPKIIILLGAVSARHVMGRSDGIMRLRGKWLEYYVNDHMVPVMPTLHPAYLLRRPIDKRLAWRDLQEIATKVNSLGLLEREGARG